MYHRANRRAQPSEFSKATRITGICLLPANCQEFARFAWVYHLDRQTTAEKLSDDVNPHSRLHDDGLNPFNAEKSQNVGDSAGICLSNRFDKDNPVPINEANRTFGVPGINANPIVCSSYQAPSPTPARTDCWLPKKGNISE